MNWDTLPERFYSDRFLDDILQDCEIEEHLRDPLLEWLERAAKNRHLNQSVPEKLISPTELKKALDGLARDAHAMKERLESTDDAVWEFISGVGSAYRLSDEYMGVNYTVPNYHGYGEEGEISIGVIGSNLGEPYQTISIASLISAMEQFSELAQITPQAFPPKSLPAQKVKPLSDWMVEMQNLWINLLDRKFTRDVADNGDPITNAARFCVAAYKVLDPETPKSLVLNEMKKAITKHNDFLRAHPDWNK